jgi:hypothetical protein
MSMFDLSSEAARAQRAGRARSALWAMQLSPRLARTATLAVILRPLCAACAVGHGAAVVEETHDGGLYWVEGERIARERRAEEDMRKCSYCDPNCNLVDCGR